MATERSLNSEPNRVQIENGHILLYRRQIHLPEKWNQTFSGGLSGGPRRPQRALKGTLRALKSSLSVLKGLEGPRDHLSFPGGALLAPAAP